jgi:uncharacterized protein YdhG (YjbR/CyaY superfamily)
MNEKLEDYIKLFSKEKKQRFYDIIDVIKTYTDVEPVISYGLPTFIQGKTRIHIGMWTSHIALYPGPSIIKSVIPFLEDTPYSKGTILFLDHKELPIDLIKHIVSLVFV